MTPEQAARFVLATLRCPLTTPNVAALLAWFRAEGGAGPQWGIPGNLAAYNPLNTTLKLTGSYDTPGNVPPVQGYINWAQGLAATVGTLEQANFAAIVAVLGRSGGCRALSAAVAASPWGTGAFACPEGPEPAPPQPSPSASPFPFPL